MTKAKTDEYTNVSAGPVQLSVGPMLAPGDASSKVDPKDPADKALIDEGFLVPKEEGE